MKIGQNKPVRNSGFTLTEIAVVASLLSLVLILAVPSFLKSQRTSQANLCISNLRAIETAKQQWATDKNKTATDVPRASDLFGPASYIKQAPVCPAGGVYELRNVRQRPLCSVAGHTL